MKGAIRCNKCGAAISAKAKICPKCNTATCHIVIYWGEKPWKYYTEEDERTPYQYTTALKDLIAMNREMETIPPSFNPAAWLPENRKARKIKYVVEKFLADIETGVQEKRLSANTYAAYCSRLSVQICHPQYGLGERDIGSIKTIDIRQFREALPTELGMSTHNAIMVALHCLFVWAEEVGMIENVPVFPKVKKGTRRGQKPKKQKALTIAEQQAALAKIPDEHREFFEFETETGTRPGETCVVQVGDFNFRERMLTVQRTLVSKVLKKYGYIKESDKENHSNSTDESDQQIASIPLSPRAFEIAKKHSAGKLPGDFLFLNKRGKVNRHYTVNFAARIWDAFSGTGVTHYEGTRHSFCTQIVQANKDKSVAQMLLRHACSESTDRYIHHDRDYLREALANRSNIVDIHKKRAALAS